MCIDTKQRPTPDIVMDGQSNRKNGASPAMDMMQVLTVDSLKQLRTDLDAQ